MTEINEKDLYDPLLEWLEEKYDYYTGGESYYNGRENWYKNIGPSQRCRLDVIGVKNIGPQKWTLADDLELIGIEVKTGPLQYKDFAQAAGYKIFVHKAYLATTDEIKAVDEHWARILGVGLITIEVKSRGNFEINIKQDASYQTPNRCEMLRMLRRMSIGQCTICKNYFMLWEKMGDNLFHTYILLPRFKQIKRILKRDDEEDWEQLMEHPEHVSEEEKINRYICRPCTKLFELDIKGQPESEEGD